MNPADNVPMPVEWFESFQNWIVHDGTGQPVADEQRVKVMYSNGAVSAYVRPAYAWRHWTGGRDWWLKPDPCDRLYIIMYVVV
jgi:hypothetical protein